ARPPGRSRTAAHPGPLPGWAAVPVRGGPGGASPASGAAGRACGHLVVHRPDGDTGPVPPSPQPSARARLPSTPGVYRFRDAGGRVLYLGRAVQLRRRVGSYWTDLGDRSHLAAMVARIARIEAVSCDSEHEAAWLERNLP